MKIAALIKAMVTVQSNGDWMIEGSASGDTVRLILGHQDAVALVGQLNRALDESDRGAKDQGHLRASD